MSGADRRGELMGALRREVDRVGALLRSAPDPTVPALGAWSFAELAMHLSQAWLVVPALATGDVSEVDALIPDRRRPDGAALLDDVWDLAGVTAAAVEADPERDPVVLADRLEARADRFLRWLGTAPGGAQRPWLVDDVTATPELLASHLLSETVVHGRDLAAAAGRRWPVSRRHAILVVDGFLVAVLEQLDPRAMVRAGAAAGLRAAYGLHLRRGPGYRLAFDDGAVTVERGVTRPVDCHLSADPAGFLLVAWGRRSAWAALLRGQFVAWGRRPWLAVRFRKLLRNP